MPLDTALAGDADALLARADELASQERHVEAARLLLSGLATLPTARRGAVHVAIARHYHRAGLWDSVAEHADAALAAGAGSAEALFLAGDARRRQEDLEAAEPLLVRAREADPSLLEATAALASLRRLREGPEASLALLGPYFENLATDNLPNEDPDAGGKPRSEALLEYARSLNAAGRPREAVDHLVELLARDPFLREACADLAQAYFRARLRSQGQLAQKIFTALEKSSFEAYLVERMEKAGAVAFARTQRAVNRMEAKRFREAYEDLRAALAIDRSDARVPIHFAAFCIRFLRFEEASRELAACLEAGSEPASGLHWMAARVFLERGLHKEALVAARAAREALAAEGDRGGYAKGQAPAFSLALVEARSAIESADLDEARESVERAATLEPERWEVPYWRGRIALAEGDPKVAIEHFREAYSDKTSRFTDLVYHYGVARARAGDTDTAIFHLEQITRREPHYTEAFEELLNILVLSEHEAHAEKRQEVEEAFARIAEPARRARELRAEIDRTPMGEAAHLYRDLGVAELFMGQRDAHDFLFLAAGLDRRDPVVLRHLVPLLRRPEDSFLRLHLLERLHALAPDDDTATDALARLYVFLRARLERAAELAQRVHERSPSEDTFRLQASLAWANGDKETSLDWLRRGLDAFPESEALEELRARIEEGAGDETDAVAPPGEETGER